MSAEDRSTPQPAQRAAYEPVVRLLRPTPYDPDMKRPGATVAGALLVLVGAVVGIASIIDMIVHWRSYAGSIDLDAEGVELPPETIGLTLAAAIVAIGVAVVIELVCAALIYRGGNVARLVVMSVAAVSICTAFAGWWARDQEITFRTTLPSLAVDILVLLALSSRSAAAYARRREKPGGA